MKQAKQLFFLILFLLSLYLSTSIVVAAETCPIGLVNDTAPGSCALYIDKNADNLCDLSQNITDSCDINITATDLTSTEIKSMTVEQVAEHYGVEGEKFAQEISKVAGVAVKKSDSFQILHDTYGVRPVTVREIAVAMSKNSSVSAVSSTTKISYYVFLIMLITIIPYLITWFLSKKGVITSMIHRKIWNWLLLITFIPVLFTSIFWLLRVDFGIIVNLPFNVTFWHVEFGIAMILISLFHIVWHTRYYTHK